MDPLTQLVNSNMTLGVLLERLSGLLSFIVPVVAGLAVLAFFVGVARFVFSAGDSGSHESGKLLMLWGLIALFVMFSVWGLVRVLSATFFPGLSV